MTTIRDIAKKTGYSVSTVSRVLNNHPYVSDQKRREILKVIKELDYVPNHMARNLSYGQTKNIGVVVPYTDHPYFDQLLSGIIEAAFARGFKVTLLPTNYEPQTEKNYLQEFAAKGFDGLVITSRANELELIKPYQHYGKIVFCEQVADFSCAYINRKDSLTEALRYLKNQGVKKIGITLGRDQNISYNSQITLELTRKFFPDFTIEQVAWNCFNEAAGVTAGKLLATQHCDGILTNSDLVAAGILKSYPAITKSKLIGRDNLIISDFLHFPTIEHHLKKCGQTAVDLLFTEATTRVPVGYEFIIR